MQSTRLLIAAQRCSSASRINQLLRRCLTISATPIKANINHLSIPLVDPNPSTCTNRRLLSLKENGIINVRKHQPVRYASSGNLPSHIKVTLPALSPTMETGTLRGWSKQEGEKVSEGDILAEIETDKATLGFESSNEGYLAKIIIPAGTKDVPVGKLCAIIVEKEQDVAAFKDYKDDGSASPSKAKPTEEQSTAKKAIEPVNTGDSANKREVQASTTEKKETATRSSSEGGRVFASPFAKKIAQEKGISLDLIQGTGPNGRVVAEDVEKFIKEGGAKAKAAVKKEKDVQTAQPKVAKKEVAARTAGYNEQQISDLRSEYARRVAESKTTIPHYYLTVEVELDEIQKLRQKLNDMLSSKSKEKSRGITINDFIIKAAALACKKRPETNSVWMDTTIRQYETVDINIAVSTDSGVVITPIVYNVDTKGLSAISKEMSELTEKANSGKLTDTELEAGTFTISNLGMYGITNFSAIIYPQQSAILAIGGVDTKLVPASDSPKGFRQSTVLNVTLACDHRVIDGAVGAQWLQEFKQYLESPGSMIL